MIHDNAFSDTPPDFGIDWFSGHEELGQWDPSDIYSPWASHSDHGHVIGTPEQDASHWVHQTTPFTCAVVSQQMILNQFGIDVSEAQLVYDATSHGWLSANGTSPSDAGQLLEFYGVHCHSYQGADIESLLSELAHGHKVIVGVDGGELLKQDWFFEDWFNPNGADHAVVVTGLDMRDPSHPMVVLNDPGHPHGAGATYPLDEFLDAWADSGQMYIATDIAPGELGLHSIFGANFNSDTGMYMDIAFWTSFLATVLQAVSSTAEQYAIHEDAWNIPMNPTDMFDYWETLDDAARNNLFCAI